MMDRLADLLACGCEQDKVLPFAAGGNGSITPAQLPLWQYGVSSLAIMPTTIKPY